MFEIIMLSGFLYAATSQMRGGKQEGSRKNGKTLQRKSHAGPQKGEKGRKHARPGEPRQKPCNHMVAA